MSLPVMIWYWGRRGAPVGLTQGVARLLRDMPDIQPLLSLSRQSELFAETAALGVPGFHVDTYGGPASALLGSLRLPGIAGRLRRFARGNGVQVAIAMMRHLWSPVAFRALRAGGARVLLILHDATPHPGEAPLLCAQTALDLAATDGLIVLSEHVRRAAIRRYRYPEDRIWTVPLGWAALGGGEAGPRQLPVDRPVRLLFFGRLVAYKGLDLLAAAFDRLARTRALELHVVGQGEAGALGALAGRADVHLDIRWVPEGEIAAVLRRGDVLVAPYREASQSGVIPLAYAEGLPVVATPVGALVEQVRDGVTGLVAPRVDADALTETLGRLLDDPALYRACSAGALAASRSEFSLDRFAEGLCAAARAVAALPPRQGARGALPAAQGGRARRSDAGQ